MNRLLLSILLVAFVFFNSCKSEDEDGIIIVTPAEMQSLMDLEDVQLIDVRTPQERRDGFIKNSQNIDFNSPTFDADILNLDKSKPVILYCRSGRRSAACGKKMKAAGFEKIYDLEGGVTQWQFKGYNLEM